ncbi:MAG: tetratricopeptide repeat protein [Nitrospirota bacterium]
MKKRFILVIALFVIALAAPASIRASAPASKCEDTDRDCKEFEQMLDAQQPDKVIARYEAAKTAQYSAAALRYIGDAYLLLASREDITPEQELGYYQKALEVKHYIAYMGLYFFYAQKDEEKALGFLREYVKTGPKDTVPYVILGESELNNKHYKLADAYLREGKKVAHAHSPRVDWLLFQANYLLGNYQFAAEMLESALTNGTFEKEVTALSSDVRFKGIESRPEFQKHRSLFKAASGRP